MIRSLAVLLFVLTLASCGEKTCREDLDCLIVCTCQPSGREATVGPYQCNQAGRCGLAFDADADCVRPCEDLPAWTPIADDDDSVAGDDDDSVAGDDDDSAGGR